MKGKADNPHLINLSRNIEIVIGRAEFILELCQNKRVLHLGCVDEGLTRERIENGLLLHTQLIKVAKEVYGVDLSEKGLELLRNTGIPNLFQGNVERLEQIPRLREKTFDVIVAAEIVEHLNNTGLFLQSVRHFFNQETIMIITTPNAYRLTGFGYRLKNQEFVHPDHNCWFSWATLTTLLRKNEYVISDTKFYSLTDYRYPLLQGIYRKAKRWLAQRSSRVSGKTGPPQDATPRLRQPQKRQPGLQVMNVFNILSRRFMFRISPFFADGLIFVVKPGRARIE